MELRNFRNIEAEQNILGSILINNNSILDIVDMIEPKDFYEPKHMIIYSTMTELYKQNKAIDITTVYNMLGTEHLKESWWIKLSFRIRNNWYS